MNLSETTIRKIINKYNVEEPKNPRANKDKLILVDNNVTVTVRNHLGNIIATIAEGHWGTGKTWSALKLYHDLKDKILVTYVPARYIVDAIKKPQTKVEGVGSTIATAIAEALCKPSTLATKVPGVLTNAPDTEVSINDELENVLEEYYLEFLREKDLVHLLLIDELETSIKLPKDIDAIVKTLITLRELFDRYGLARLTVVMLLAPLTPGTKLHELTGGSERLSSYIKSKITPEEPQSRRYVLDKVIFIDLDNVINTKIVLRNLSLRIIEVLKQELNIDVNISGIDNAVDYIAKSLKWVRFGRDLLIEAITEAIIEGTKHKKNEVNLCEFTEKKIKEALGFNNRKEITKVLIHGRLGSVSISTRHVREILDSIIEDIRKERIIDSFYRVDDRKEVGFTSFTYIMKKSRREKGKEKILETPVTFWLRFTDITLKGLYKANKVFEGRKVLIITTEKCRHGKLVHVRKTFDLVDIIYLPSELAYYIIAGDRIRNIKVRSTLEERFNQESRPIIINVVRRMIS